MSTLANAWRTFEPGIVPELGGSALGDRPLATGLQPPPHPQCIELPNPRRVCDRLCSSGYGYAFASRTQPNYLTPDSLTLVQRLGGECHFGCQPRNAETVRALLERHLSEGSAGVVEKGVRIDPGIADRLRAMGYLR